MADQAVVGVGGGPGRAEALLAGAILEVDLPPYQYRLSRSLRLSPIITSYVHERKSYVQAVQINEVALLGQPADYSIELALRLQGDVSDGIRKLGGRLLPVVTSFNGDYIGYLIPHDRYIEDDYESRDMNFFGPWSGEYFTDLSARLLKAITPLSKDITSSKTTNKD